VLHLATSWTERDFCQLPHAYLATAHRRSRYSRDLLNLMSSARLSETKVGELSEVVSQR